mmetsp:Transcript_5636/g.8154  ORF Transcript_5636/g.8154 Transcript_5636/m.8154 type:complete len:106 (-) Transcript_5636:45-362(-)
MNLYSCANQSELLNARALGGVLTAPVFLCVILLRAILIRVLAELRIMQVMLVTHTPYLYKTGVQNDTTCRVVQYNKMPLFGRKEFASSYFYFSLCLSVDIDSFSV